ncbi:TPA: hypothetical protein RFW29_003968 [Klebsiella pneumoniae subsp. pneumoniae]|nr:hypothetical protein [Klebsiella pneumoniae]HDU3708714.1 hypothetical protein [Klebsiella pneumoniae subsp. pneumoniae]HDU3759987.1 hypothetical protein [Klebsiella pneumoniae]HDU5914423.1 hypothetical protein [Klebsiella pneumoniae subsp. pneumoniae]
MTITLQAVNELIASLESAGELSIREQKFLKLAKAFKQLAAENVGLNSFIVDACWIVDDGQYCDATDFMPETPATDAYLAGIKAEVLPANIAEIIDSGDLETICWQHEHYKAEDYRLALYRFRTDREGAANE